MASDSLVHAVAGAGGGMVSMALTYPLVTVSTRSQVSKKDSPSKAAASKGKQKMSPAPPSAAALNAAKNIAAAFTASFLAQKAAFVKVVKDEGVGIESAMFGIAVTQGVYYGMYEYVKAAFERAQQTERAISTLESMAAGAIAGAATSLITNPIWVVNVRATVKKSKLDDDAHGTSANVSKPLSTSDIVMKIYKEEGILGFWKGIVPALILVINPIIQYTVFERLKDWMQTRKNLRGAGALSAFDFFILGAVSKLCATAITYPYIVVKSRMQLKQSDDDKERYNNVLDGIRKILKSEGVGGLYKGIEAKLLQSVLASAFTFAFKEEMSLPGTCLEAGKDFIAATAYLAYKTLGPRPELTFLELRKSYCDGTSILLQQIASNLTRRQQYKLYSKIWELSKMRDPRVCGDRWGEEHAFDDPERLHAALVRTGFLAPTPDTDRDTSSFILPVSVLPYTFGEGGLGAQYFSLGEKLGRDPAVGYIGFINGMGVPTLDHAGSDTSVLSDRFAFGHNIHVVYNPTHQPTVNSSLSHFQGFVKDVLRMKATDGGATSKQAYLLAQQWIDFLLLGNHENLKFLQVCHSEGATHTNAALRLLQKCAPQVLNHLRIISFAPAFFLNPNLCPGLQVMNFVKLEDRVVQPWGSGSSTVKTDKHVTVVTHKIYATDVHNDPHDFMSWDFVTTSAPFFQSFFETGNLL
ncbi:hypothetical protein HDU82_006663 [Entophlyctis luteolus]|nr:hypothetical protein HDU82_006663 [Entophlyctis luteolus]